MWSEYEFGGVVVSVSDLNTSDQQVATPAVQVTTWMADRLWAGKPSLYVTSHQVNSAFHPYGVGKSSTGLSG